MTLAFPTPDERCNANRANAGSFEPLTLTTTLRAVGSYFLRVYRHFENRRNIARLAAMEDRMLQDIGITRDDVLSSLEAHDGIDASIHLQLRAEERREADILRRQQDWHWKDGEL
ncbi:DUF1127 domain-containing protein [Polycladidibacter stylochi]|uniref:DUF1127 domain-containing protein n=1 Tax=Polycladidibacter stylochi TaxID=1807766 RepID=UPI000831E04D|nr:DUF1127 domain-containing protein [Pseudovibrio stylochi]